MAKSPIRVGVTAFGKRIHAGHVNKAGNTFLGTPQDVTSDVLKAIGDYVGIGNLVNVEVGGVTQYVIAVLAPGSVISTKPAETAENG